MALIENLNLWPPSNLQRNLALNPPPKLFSFKPSATHSIRKTLHTCRCSLVNEQQQQQASFTDQEKQLIDALIGIQGRGKSASPQQLNDVERAVQVLEGQDGVGDPTSSDLIEGRWQLMFTTRPGTASPIQRTFVGVDFFSVFQEVYLRTNDPRVSNIVKFSDWIGSSINKRWKTDPLPVPYPVPFRLLGDEAKGWLDTTYLSHSGNLRISRGNKGTTFVLQKKTDPRQKLLAAISTGTGVEEAIDEFISLSKSVAKDEPVLLEGEWQMIWSSQVETDSWLENAGNGLMGSQIVKNEQMKFLVNIFPGIRFSMIGNKSGTKTYDVTMDDAALIGGPFGYPLEMETKINMELLYNDDKIRISKGYNNILFVHLRASDGSK
ncbi:putative plastid-lipid-associated protein 12, chloroplastic isoform X1 [Gossypium australe]|uniref:Putative plastid-lipid-associated protein 12, chloroplastic isoform X1 n=1 Tax=Gossypium australe TaxID=47621 RepID=A0A5B6VP88_9ROSI|nr:putative plastid-lipid-associated protein 12, chloroplastic isoform X1 [Gossypium australe]